MRLYVQLEKPSGTAFWVNPKSVALIEPTGNHTAITVGGRVIVVKGAAEEILMELEQGHAKSQ